MDTGSHSVVSFKGDEDTPREYMLSTGMLGSLYESTVWEELTGEESVSTISILAKASEEDIDILLISGANLDTEIEKLNTDETTKQKVINAVNSGKVVTIPVEDITMGDWHGTGYIVTNPETGAGAYMISGGLNGGEATAILTTEVLVAIIAEIIGVYWFVSVFAATGFFITAPVMFAIAGLFILITLELVTFNMSASYFDYLESGDMDDYMNAEEKAGMLTLFGYMAVIAAQYLSYGTNVVGSGETGNESGEASLRFGDNDLVYGPSADGKLVELQQKAGGKLLSDVGNPYDNGYGSDWLKFSTDTIDNTVNSGNKIHFDLTYMDDIEGVLNGTSEYSNSITAGELRYIRDNWNRLSNGVKFYINEKEVKPPWMN